MPDRIVIVGGGFTGLVAARALVRASPRLRITVLERGHVMGGLAAGFPTCGTMLEKAYHYILLGDSALIALIRELGLEDRMIVRDGSVGIYDGRRVHSFSSALDVLRFPNISLVARVRLGIAMLRLQRMRSWRPLATVTARDWLLRNCGAEAMRAIWDPLLRGKFDRWYDQVSMAWLWARIHTRANSRSGSRERLGYLHGGFVEIVRRLEAELAGAGVELRTNAVVEALVPAGAEGGGSLRLAGGETLAFDRCLFTGPSTAFSRLLPADRALDAYRAQLESVPYLGAVCVILISDQKLGDLHWVNVHEEGAPFLVFINHTALTGPALYQGRHVYYLGTYRPHDSPWMDMPEPQLLREWLAYLSTLHPGFDPARVQESHVFRFRNAQHVVDCRHEEKIPPFRTPLPGVYLANFSQIFPEDRGTNFAVRDGLAVARCMLEDLASTATAR